MTLQDRQYKKKPEQEFLLSERDEQQELNYWVHHN